jgi:hypothetical protein
MARRLTRADILPMADYASERASRRRQIVELKRARRMDVGPFATFHFECFATMWHQVHEMLFVEKGGDDQIDGELAAYNPLIPDGRELVATIMLEIEDPVRRARVLASLGGIEDTVSLRFAGETIAGRAETDAERTRADGKASSVHFVRFPFNRQQIAKFGAPATEVIVGFAHPEYRHMAAMPEPVRAALRGDFD